MTPEQFLDRARPFFAETPGKLALEPTSAGHELRFEGEAYDLYSCVLVPTGFLGSELGQEHKLLEAQAMAEMVRESILHGRHPFRAGYPKGDE